METHADLTHKGISHSSSQEWPLSYRHDFQRCPCLLLSQHFSVVLSLGSFLPTVKAFQITFSSMLSQTLDTWDNRGPKRNNRDDMEIGQRAKKR